MDNLTLIHLVSEQTLQNLLPTLALRPSHVIQVRSSDPRFDRTPSYLETACREAGLTETKFLTPETIPGASPDITETSAFLTTLCERQKGHSLCLNFTGGTKLMSIGSYRVAEHLRIPSLYTDTLHRRNFVDGGTGPFLKILPELHSFLNQITVPVVMAAQGKEFRKDSITPQLLEFGKAAWSIRSQHHEAVAAWTSRIRTAVPRDKNGRVESKSGKLKDFLLSPLPFPEADAAQDYLDAAVQAGLLSVDASGEVHMQTEPKRSAVERVSNLLDGAWLELAVAAAANDGSRYGDIHWSVQPSDQTGEDYGETDLIAVDRRRLNLAVVSCKTSTAHVSSLEHLSSWRDRTRTLGGSHASGILCLFRVKSPDEEGRLRAMGKKMGIEILIGDEIVTHFSE